MIKIELGDKVKCIHTGFIGIVVSRTEFFNGCIQLGILPSVKNKKTAITTMPEEIGIDEQSLSIVSRGKKGKEVDKAISIAKKKSYKARTSSRIIHRTGGPMTRAIKRRNF